MSLDWLPVAPDPIRPYRLFGAALVGLPAAILSGSHFGPHVPPPAPVVSPLQGQGPGAFANIPEVFPGGVSYQQTWTNVTNDFSTLLLSGANIATVFNRENGQWQIRLNLAVVRVFAAYSLLVTDAVALLDATVGAFTLTLPPAASTQGPYLLRKVDGGGNDVTVAPSGADKVDGGSSLTLHSGGTVRAILVSDFVSNWYTVAIG